MRILESWLKRYIAFTMTPEELSERLTMLGLEFENVERLGERYHGFVVGEVIERASHPNAERLTVCRVSVGREELQIVCGAPNVAAGQKVVVGLVGATVPRDQHDPDGKPFVLGKVKIRGVESAGMICSEYELDLGKDAAGILILDADAKAGSSFAEYLGLNDVAYDIEITPNRPDWLSHFGVAREIGVLTRKQPKLPTIALHEVKERTASKLSVTVKDRQNCLRFAARVIRGAKVGPSPRWLQNLLRNAGLRPRNNVVDITNFVMLECGQPLHAFDYALLHGNGIVVRRATPGAPFTTLDGHSHLLPGDAVMVCDAEREVSIAGVMGGQNSEISESTTDIVLESACWNPSSIRRTSKALGIISDASQRFERGGDPGIVLYALNRAAALMAGLGGGEVLRGAIDVKARPVRSRVVPVRPARTNAVLGTRLSGEQIKRLLGLLGMEQKGKTGATLRFSVPTYRVDIGTEIDLIEEVARVYGYDNIAESTTASIDYAHPFPTMESAAEVRNALIGAGFQEAITNSMQDEQKASMGGATPVRILNPLSQDMSCMRTSLVPGLLDAAFRNQNYGNFNLRLFEIGHVFAVDPSGPRRLVGDYREEARVCFLMTGLAQPRYWGQPPRNVDLFDLKGVVEDFPGKFALDKGFLISYSTSNGLTDNSLAVDIHGTYAGYLGAVKEEVLKLFGVEQPVFVAELALDGLEARSERKYHPLPRFPRVKRDVAFVVNDTVSAGSVMELIRAAAGEWLGSLEVFDVFAGESLGPGKKNLAFSVELLSPSKTLTDADIEAVIGNIVRRVEQETGGTFRAR